MEHVGTSTGSDANSVSSFKVMGSIPGACVQHLYVCVEYAKYLDEYFGYVSAKWTKKKNDKA